MIIRGDLIKTAEKQGKLVEPDEVIGKFIDDDDIEKEVIYREFSVINPTPNVLRMLVARPTEDARETDEYLEARRIHGGDDWEDDLTSVWDSDRLPKRLRNIIRNRVLPLIE